MVGTIEIVMRKIAPSGSVSETVLVSLPGAESQEATHSSDILIFPNLEIHINEQTVYHNDIPVPLTHHEFFTLLYLAQHPSWVLSKEAFKPFMIPIMVVVSIVGCGYISYRFMLRPLEHLDEVAEAAQKLAHPTDAPIMLSGNLKSMEDDLNRVREQTLNNIKSVQETEQRKDDLLVYLAHDLKTPLTSVLGYLKLIEDEPEITPELVHKYSGIARKKAQRLEELINEFFEITRFSTHKLSLEPVQTHLSRMLMQMTYEFNPILAVKGLEWDLQIAENVEMMCDSDKLERAVDNLIRNAVNYSYPNTKIFFSLTRTSDSIRICVQNKGPTIPPEKMERIFEQFYRLDAARSSDTGGAGLGLAIAKEIIELHHGTIAAYSEDENIQFIIQLPLDSQKITRI